MLKRNNEYSNAEKLSMLINGSSFATYIASKDRDKYAKFKASKKIELSDSDIESMNVLSILDRLGYPMDELGTYLYKELITEICNTLKELMGADLQKCNFLLRQLNDNFSQFYFEIAREYLEIGIKPFHFYVKEAMGKINYQNMDLELSEQIFGKDRSEQSYGLQALKLAAYTMDTCTKNKPKSLVLKN